MAVAGLSSCQYHQSAAGIHCSSLFISGVMSVAGRSLFSHCQLLQQDPVDAVDPVDYEHKL